MRRPTPTRRDHQRFAVLEGWAEVRDARGRTGSHHITCELVLETGEVLRTRISHSPDRSEYGPSIWAHILPDQLKVTESVFWDVLTTGEPPQRPGPATLRREPLPTDMIWQLRNRVGLDDAAVAELSLQEATERLARYYTTGE